MSEEVNLQRRISNLSDNSNGMDGLDFDEEVKIQKIDKQVKRSNSSLFKLARKSMKLITE